MYLCYKNILEYAQIMVTGGKFMILDIEGHPTIFRPIVWRDQIEDQIGFPKCPYSMIVSDDIKFNFQSIFASILEWIFSFQKFLNLV